MTITLGFDVYGTLIDTQGVLERLQPLAGDKANAFSTTWREKQLEYTFRRGLMRQYDTFPVCTRDALDYCCNFYQIQFSQNEKQELLDSYLTLPVFDDVEAGLIDLKNQGVKMYAFSNGISQALNVLLTNAGIRKYFNGLVSVDDVKSFKPDPAVYKHFINVTNSKPENAWLISSNGFDVIGAMSYGMKAAWVQRSEENVFDSWGVEPNLTVSSLENLHQAIPQKL